jgi:hypothetical protein
VRVWLIHAVFGTILVCSLTVRVIIPDALVERGSVEPAVLKVAHSNGWAFREHETIADTGRQALIFETPRCSEPLRVILHSLTFEEEPATDVGSGQNYVQRYVYIDHTWNEPHRLAVWAQRIKYAVLAAFGATEYIPGWHLLEIDMPPNCPAAGAIDWRMVWSRDYLGSASAGSKY